MKNVVLFVLTVAAYFAAWCLLAGAPENLGELALTLGIFSVLCAPFNIGGHIFTAFGNAESERSIYSIFSIYQKAGQDAVAFLFSLYQNAGQDAAALLSLYQKAEQDARVFLFSIYQNAGQDVGALLFSLYQNAGRDAEALLFSLYQKAGEKKRTFGLFSSLRGA